MHCQNFFFTRKREKFKFNIKNTWKRKSVTYNELKEEKNYKYSISCLTYTTHYQQARIIITTTTKKNYRNVKFIDTRSHRELLNEFLYILYYLWMNWFWARKRERESYTKREKESKELEIHCPRPKKSKKLIS